MSGEVLSDYGPVQLARRLGWSRSEVGRACDAGLVPAADVDGCRWSAEVVDDLAGRAAQIKSLVPEPDIGATRSAARLADRTGLEVDPGDIHELAERGELEVVAWFKEWPLYSCDALDALDAGVVASVVDERLAWLAASLTASEAAERLGLGARDFGTLVDRVLAEAGRFGRYATTAIEALAGDEEVMDHLAAEQVLGPDQATAHLEVRRRDFDYVVAAGWVAPKRWARMPVGRRSEVQVPLYRAGDLDALRDLPGVDWEQVRAVKPGERSPLRRFARLPDTRAQAVRRFVARLGDRWDIDAYAWYRAGGSRWEIDWVPGPDGAPTIDQVAALLETDPSAARHAGDITVGTDAGAAVRWARRMLEPGAAVVLDTETTDLDGSVIEIAVIDAHTGDALLDTLVNPERPISSDASLVHGLNDSDVAGAPTWPQVLHRLLEATTGRTVLAYNAEFDHTVIVGDCRRYGLDPAHLAEHGNWGCVMDRRSDWLRASRWLRLDGGHRALGDTRAALDVLRDMTQPAHQTADRSQEVSP